jgi:hypothetical protein
VRYSTAAPVADCDLAPIEKAVDRVKKSDYPNIVPCLVLPFERECPHAKGRYPALVFAQKGAQVLYADEGRREFGVGTLDGARSLRSTRQFPTLDRAAREFLACA